MLGSPRETRFCFSLFVKMAEQLAPSPLILAIFLDVANRAFSPSSGIFGISLRRDESAGFAPCACGHGGVPGKRFLGKVGLGEVVGEPGPPTDISWVSGLPASSRCLGEPSSCASVSCANCVGSRPDIYARLVLIAPRVISLQGSDVFRINGLVTTVQLR